MKIKERKIGFKRIEPWIPQAQAAAKREQFQQLPRSRAIPAIGHSLNRRTSRSSSNFLDREQFRKPDVVAIEQKFQQLPAARAVPTTSGKP
ncbi:hypothetical protein WN944_014132 [Citrus x changshan-huyou]|uniref:Uncharacterized protein n=1 Tax=Citrus x changshan-huyou TaxID=2935761 RepID=A0AAP0MBL5_9ROSI